MDSILQSAWRNSILSNSTFGDRLRPDDLIYSSPSENHRRGQTLDMQDKYQIFVNVFDYIPSDITVELVDRKRAIAVTGKHNAEPHPKKTDSSLPDMDDDNRHQSRSFSERYFLPPTTNPSTMTYEFTPDQCRLIITVIKKGFEKYNQDTFTNFNPTTKCFEPPHKYPNTYADSRPTSLAPLPDEKDQTGLKISPEELFRNYPWQDQRTFEFAQAQAAYDSNSGWAPTSLPPLLKPGSNATTTSTANIFDSNAWPGPNYSTTNWYNSNPAPFVPNHEIPTDPSKLIDQLETMPSYYTSISKPATAANVATVPNVVPTSPADALLADALKVNSAKLEALMNASNNPAQVSATPSSKPDKPAVKPTTAVS